MCEKYKLTALSVYETFYLFSKWGIKTVKSRVNTEKKYFFDGSQIIFFRSYLFLTKMLQDLRTFKDNFIYKNESILIIRRKAGFWQTAADIILSLKKIKEIPQNPVLKIRLDTIFTNRYSQMAKYVLWDSKYQSLIPELSRFGFWPYSLEMDSPELNSNSYRPTDVFLSVCCTLKN
jgi:hypothetical protein